MCNHVSGIDCTSTSSSPSSPVYTDWLGGNYLPLCAQLSKNECYTTRELDTTANDPHNNVEAGNVYRTFRVVTGSVANQSSSLAHFSDNTDVSNPLMVIRLRKDGDMASDVR